MDNEDGYPPKKASYWKRRCKRAEKSYLDMESALRKIESLSFDRVELGENFTREMAQETDYLLTEVGEIAHRTREANDEHV